MYKVWMMIINYARPHVAQTTQDLLGRTKWEVLQHPSYSPDLSTCDYHVFVPLKKSLKGRRFKSDAEVEFAVSEWFHKQPQEFYQQGIYRLLLQWDSCLNAVSYTHLLCI